ncbi:hypothetical protein EDD21DRAFT_448230, partial [Dissophora ornata]
MTESRQTTLYTFHTHTPLLHSHTHPWQTHSTCSCLISGELASNAFKVEISSVKAVGNLKGAVIAMNPRDRDEDDTKDASKKARTESNRLLTAIVDEKLEHAKIALSSTVKKGSGCSDALAQKLLEATIQKTTNTKSTGNQSFLCTLSSEFSLQAMRTVRRLSSFR